MADHQDIRERLLNQSDELVAKRERIQLLLWELERDQARETAESEAAVELRNSTLSPIFNDLILSISREQRRLQKALSRIESDEFDRCSGCGGRLSRERLDKYPFEDECPQCWRSFPSGRTRALRVQHADIRLQTTKLSLLLNSGLLYRPSVSLGRMERAALRLMLTEFADRLSEHFSCEERGGYMAEPLAAAPRLSRRAARLERQHAEFRSRCRELIHRGGALEFREDQWRALRRYFDQFSRDLLAHENEEGRLASEAFLTDIGASG